MSGQSNGTLQIYTLGRFRVYYGQRDLTEEYSRSKKPWFLFKFLLTNNGEVFPSDYIMATLWPEEESQNPTHSLRNLVYRLRNLLEEEQGNGQYIVNQQGHYSFGREGEYWLDVEEMERAAKEAFLLEDENPKKIELLQRACELYEGEYLPTLAYESWTFNQRNYFQRLHLKTVRELNRLLKENGQFEEIIQHCEKIIDLEPFEECLHRDYIEALIENGQQARAKIHYQETNARFKEELDVPLNFCIEKMMGSAKKEDLNDIAWGWNDLSEVLESDDVGEGPLICDRENFRLICKLEERRAERNIRGAVLASLRLSPRKGIELSPAVLKEKSDIFQETLQETLRHGDVIFPNRTGYFFLLFVDTPAEQIEDIVQRVGTQFFKKFPEGRERLNIRYRKLLMGGTL